MNDEKLHMTQIEKYHHVSLHKEQFLCRGLFSSKPCHGGLQNTASNLGVKESLRKIKCAYNRIFRDHIINFNAGSEDIIKL